MNPFKVKTESEEHSKEIQEWLFSKGVHWWDKDRFVLEGCREIYYGAIGDYISGSTGNSEYFEEHPLPEKWFYDGELQDKPKIQSQLQLFTNRHVAEAILEGKELQFLESSGSWSPITYLGFGIRNLDKRYPREIRVKPRICNGVELDPYLTEHPEIGSYYYHPDPLRADLYGMKLWDDDDVDIYWFELGFVYATKISAAKHGQAMVNLLN